MGFEAKLKDLTLKIGSGSTPRGGQASYLENGEIHLIRSQNIYNHQFEWNGIAYISEEQAEKLKNVIVEEKDILINITGDSVARNMLATNEFLPARVNQHVSIIRCDYEKLDPYYLSAVLTSENMQRQLLSLAQTGGTRAALTKTMLENLEIPIFDIKKQRSIGKALNMYNSKIENNTKMIDSLEQLAQTLFKRWFVDFEFPNEDGEPYKSSGGEMVESELGMVPKGWTVNSIRDISTSIKSGGTPRRKQMEYWDGGTVPWIKTKEIKNNYIIRAEENITQLGLENSSAKILEKDTILMAMYGATAGQLAMLKFPASTNQACCGITTEIPNYLYQQLLFSQGYIKSLATGSAQQNLNKEIITNLRFIFPITEVLIEIENTLKSFSNLIEKAYYENSTLMGLRDTLLPKLLSGEIELPDEMEDLYEK